MEDSRSIRRKTHIFKSYYALKITHRSIEMAGEWHSPHLSNNADYLNFNLTISEHLMNTG